MSVAARIICASGNTPIMANGTLLERGDTEVTVQCDASAAAIQQGSKVVLTFDGGGERWTGVVDAVEDRNGNIHLRVVAPNAHSADKRDYPRLHAGLPIQYKISDQSEADSWLSGGTVENDWCTPDPYMNFSVSGLRFEVNEEVQEGQILLVLLSIGTSETVWRTTVKVIRVFESNGATHRSAAVSFQHLPDEALAALSDLTLKIQETLI